MPRPRVSSLLFLFFSSIVSGAFSIACASATSTSNPAGSQSAESAAEAATRAAADYTAVGKSLEAYYRDLSARDWPAFASHFAPGAILACRWQPPGEPSHRLMVSTVPEFIAKAPEGPGSRPIFEEKCTGLQIRIDGRLAEAWSTYQARFGDSSHVDEWTGTDVFTLLKHDDRWHIVSLAYDATR